MGHEFGHGIARHRAEFNSWELVTTCAIFSRLALSSIALFPAIALGCVLSALVKDVLIGKWLSQQLEYEADVIGAAIGKAAGCSLEDILYAMSCTEILRHKTYEFKLTRSGVPALQQEVLASLRALVPNGQLPKTVYDSRDVQMVQATIDKELSTAADETMQLARKHVITLELSLARSMTYLRDPRHQWTKPHPHWLERIANVKASSHLQSVQAAWLDLTLRPCNDGQALLQAYHASSEWPVLIDSLSVDVQDTWTSTLYHAMNRARSWQQRDVLECLEHEAAKEYDMSTLAYSLASRSAYPPPFL